ncbi:uncharacterized protein V6R79_023566 [Siganus canaliculatus]
MDSNSLNREYQNTAFHQDAAQYTVTYPNRNGTKQMDEVNKKKYPVSRSGNNPGRVKRVVSCKRKTHHLTVARRKQPGQGRTCDAANKENEIKCMQDLEKEIFDVDPWEFPLNINNNHRTSKTGSEPADYYTLNELSRDHSTMTDVLFGRNLRLKVSLTLWQRSVGELLTYLLKIQDIGVLVDFLPLISKSIDEGSSQISIGCCVDLFPLVKRVFANPYEEYLTVGLKWINSVLKNWHEELKISGFRGSIKDPLDKSFQFFNQQLLEMWHQEPLLKSIPGPAGDMAKVIDSFLSQLT